jgi:hypothetical protein
MGSLQANDCLMVMLCGRLWFLVLYDIALELVVECGGLSICSVVSLILPALPRCVHFSQHVFVFQCNVMWTSFFGAPPAELALTGTECGVHPFASCVVLRAGVWRALLGRRRKL